MIYTDQTFPIRLRIVGHMWDTFYIFGAEL